MLHVMDVASRFSAPHIVASTAILKPVYVFELLWKFQFRPLDAVHADDAFQNWSHATNCIKTGHTISS